MIEKVRFNQIVTEVKEAVDEVFKYALEYEKQTNDYLLFLVNASKINETYVIEYGLDKIKDKQRLEYLQDYLNVNYTFAEEKTIDNSNSLYFEMMLYTHIWESKYFLKILLRLVRLCENKQLDWKTKIPKQSKSEFIRKDINCSFCILKLKISEIIKKGYFSQLRNAFAHSDFHINNNNIILHNFDSKDKYTIQQISTEDWSIRFCYSFLLNYYIVKKFLNEYNEIDKNITFNVTLETSKGNKKGNLYFKNGWRI